MKEIIVINGKKYLYEYKAAFIGKNKCEEFLLSSQFYFSAKKQELPLYRKKQLEEYNLDNSKFKELLKISDSEYKILEHCLYNWHLHFKHPIFLVNVTDLNSGEVIKRMYTLTSKPYDIKIKETLTESYFNISGKTCKVIKVNEGLYVTGHSWICDINLNSEETSQLDLQELHYDVEKGYYVGLDKYDGTVWNVKNLTLDSIKKLNNIISKDLINTQQLDVTAMMYPADDLFVYKLLKSGIYNNNIYDENEKNNIENILSDHFKYDEIGSNTNKGLEEVTVLDLNSGKIPGEDL